MKEARTLLVSGSLAEGKRFWTELVTYTRNARLGSGTVDISELWRRLRGEFALKDHPDYEASWQKLRALTRDYQATIETALPSGVKIDREREIDNLVTTMSTDAVCVVFGESGSGKSALVKAMLGERFPDAGRYGLGRTILISRSTKLRAQASGSASPWSRYSIRRRAPKISSSSTQPSGSATVARRRRRR